MDDEAGINSGLAGCLHPIITRVWTLTYFASAACDRVSGYTIYIVRRHR